jgi:hypothetical protein
MITARPPSTPPAIAPILACLDIPELPEDVPVLEGIVRVAALGVNDGTRVK